MRQRTNITVNTLTDLKKRKGYAGLKCTLLGYTAVNDGAFGEFYWDDASTATADDALVVQTTGITTGRWIRVVNDNVYKAAWWGLVPDSTSQGAKINAMFAAIPSGARVRFPYFKNYNSTVQIVLPKPVELDARGSRITYSGGQMIDIVTIQSSNVKIDRLKVTGDSMVYAPGNCISTEGSTNSSFYENIEITNCEVNNYRENGINLHYVTKFKVLDNKCSNFQYAGIMLNSCTHGECNFNDIKDILGVGPSNNNSYGIATTTQTAGEVLSHDITIFDNTIRNVQNWEGIDTHGGYNLTVALNKIYDCKKGIAMVSTSWGVGSKNINVCYNTIDNEALTQPDAAIQYQAGNTDLITGTITGNICIGSGIKLLGSKGLIVSHNQVIRPDLGFGIYMNNDNYNCRISHNTFTDVWHASSGNCAAIKYVDVNNQATIEGNTLVDGGFVVPAGGFKNRYGFRPNVDGVSGNTAIIGRNDFSAATVSQYANITGVTFTEQDGRKENIVITSAASYSLNDRDVNLTNGYTAGNSTWNLQSITAATDKRVLYLHNPTSNTVTLNIPVYSNPTTSTTTIAANSAIKLIYSFSDAKIFYIPIS